MESDLDLSSIENCVCFNLGDWLGMERTTLVRYLRPLEWEGLIAATEGGRGGHVELTITEKGRKTLAKTLPVWRSAQDKVVGISGRSDGAKSCGKVPWRCSLPHTSAGAGSGRSKLVQISG